MVTASLYVGAHQVVTSSWLSLNRGNDDSTFSDSWSYLVIAVQLVGELLAHTEVRLLAGLLGQSLQLIDIAVSVVFECKPAVCVEFPQSPWLVDSSG